MEPTRHATFALEAYAERAFNYLDRMVDENHLPYFNIFWEHPAEAAHDWPDFGDVMTRALQGAIMARRMTGRESINEKTWLRKTLGYIDPGTGLLTRPETSFCRAVADAGDFALTLYALVSAYDDAKDPELANVVRKMVDGFPEVRNDDPGGMCFLVKSLMAAARSLQYEPALDFAGDLVSLMMATDRVIQTDNTYPTGGHMHGLTRGLVGLADYALYKGDPVLLSRVDAAYRFVRSLDPGFGFLPEVVDRQGDVIACETCSLMDYLGIGATLANNGHPEYWDSIERLVRNHLAESQVRDASWLISNRHAVDTEQFSHREIGERMVGGYAGWSSPTHILAVREELHWGGPELRGKTRAFQNCCGGSGTHAYYIAWKNASRFANGILSVNLHIDKLLPEAEVRCFQPYRGLLTVQLKRDCDAMIRIPGFTNSRETTVLVDGKPVEFATSGNYLRLNGCRSGSVIEVNYPLPNKTETIEIGNRRLPGTGLDFQYYVYQVEWRGDTVVNIKPVGSMPDTVYSDFERRQVEVYYGEEGPGRLYEREYMKSNVLPGLTILHEDTSPLDYWWLK